MLTLSSIESRSFCWTNAVRSCPMMKSKTCATGIVTCSCSLKEYLTLCRSPMSPCLNDQIEYYHGIGDLNEEFVEKLHRETKKFRKRMGHLSDYQKQINAMVVLNRLENLDKVKEAQEKVATESKRKLARYINGEESLSEERKNSKRERNSMRID
mmetsp:Transcript_18340/g.28618  ORF Transcript_18340/g.28618 Transcript_18340/m.28618 type:complete len:155 (+) Transcript_18340:1351-1815(+)